MTQLVAHFYRYLYILVTFVFSTFVFTDSYSTGEKVVEATSVSEDAVYTTAEDVVYDVAEEADSPADGSLSDASLADEPSIDVNDTFEDETWEDETWEDETWEDDIWEDDIWEDDSEDLQVHVCDDDYATWVVVEDPTCDDSGLMALICDICGQTMDNYILDPLGHTPGDWETEYGCTCLENGLVTRYCMQCGILLDSYEEEATGHVAGDWYTVQSPAPWCDGIQQRYCVYCGEVMEETTVSYESVVMDDINDRGAFGRLNIPSLGIDVALFCSNSQYVCDCEDSANYFYYNGAYMICDHNYQGFSPLEWVSTGADIYITTEYGTTTYYVTGSDYALYSEGRLYDLSGTVSFTQWMPSCSLILKTCASGGRDILVYCD